MEALRNRPVHLTEKQHADLNELLALKDDIKALIDLLKQMRAAFAIFIILGRGLKWLSTFILFLTGVYYVVIKRDPSVLTAIFKPEP